MERQKIHVWIISKFVHIRTNLLFLFAPIKMCLKVEKAAYKSQRTKCVKWEHWDNNLCSIDMKLLVLLHSMHSANTTPGLYHIDVVLFACVNTKKFLSVHFQSFVSILIIRFCLACKYTNVNHIDMIPLRNSKFPFIANIFLHKLIDFRIIFSYSEKFIIGRRMDDSCQQSPSKAAAAKTESSLALMNSENRLKWPHPKCSCKDNFDRFVNEKWILGIYERVLVCTVYSVQFVHR